MSDPYLGQRTVMRAVLDALLPDGPIWNPIPGGGEDALHAGLSDAWQYVYDVITAWAYVRDPWKTPFLSALERECGIMPNAALSTAQRQANLAQRKFNRNKTSTINTLQAALNAAGLGVGGYGLQVFANDPPVNPATYTTYAYVTMSGGANAYSGYYTGGSAPPFAAFSGTTGGLWIINGDAWTTSPAYWGSGYGTMLSGYGVAAGSGQYQACSGEYSTLTYTPIAIPSPPSGWDCMFFLAGGPTLTTVSIPSVFRQTLIEIVCMWKPLHTWAVAMVNFV